MWGVELRASLSSNGPPYNREVAVTTGRRLSLGFQLVGKQRKMKKSICVVLQLSATLTALLL